MSAAEQLELERLLDTVFETYGFDLRSYSPPHLMRRVRAAMAGAGLASVEDLRGQLLVSPDAFARFLDAMTVRVSAFFRDPSFHRALRERVIPVLRSHPFPKIWIAGCAGGEEAYAMAILLQEEGLYERTQIYATDLSPQAIDRAKAGIYPARDVRAFTENYQRAGGTESFSNYYRAAYDRIAIVDELKRNILFFQHDLVLDHPFGEMHCISCRNVLIYFSPELRGRVLTKFARSQGPGGFFCLGHSERLNPPWLGTAFVDFDPIERIYRFRG